LKKIEEPVLRKKPLPFNLPLNIAVFTSELQTKFFPDETEATIRKHL
jgi:hypothetical protein